VTKSLLMKTHPRMSTRFGDKFFSCWSSSLEQSTTCTPSTGMNSDHFKRGLRPIRLHWCDEISAPSDY